VQLSVAGPVALTTGLMQAHQHPLDSFEIFEALEFAFFYFMPFFTHKRHLSRSVNIAQV